METIYLGGGCFWCTEAVFHSLKGVVEVVPGYMGGTVLNPSYEQVCTGTTGHAQVIKVSFDEQIITLDDILDVFFATHDPTTPNRQGNDIGTQYRSIIFYTDHDQAKDLGDSARDPHAVLSPIHTAIARKQATLPEGKFVVTQIAAASEFYSAEGYHQRYYQQHRDAPYCQLVIDPKIEKLQQQFPEKLA